MAAALTAELITALDSAPDGSAIFMTYDGTVFEFLILPEGSPDREGRDWVISQEALEDVGYLWPEHAGRVARALMDSVERELAG